MGQNTQAATHPPIHSFTQLNTWKKGHELVIHTHQLLKKFPKEQQFALANQMSRASISITSNIAEGFSRQSNKEKLQFYYISQGSLTELQNQLLISRDLQYISNKDFMDIAQETVIVHKLLTGLIKYVKISTQYTIHNTKISTTQDIFLSSGAPNAYPTRTPLLAHLGARAWEEN